MHTKAALNTLSPSLSHILISILKPPFFFLSFFVTLILQETQWSRFDIDDEWEGRGPYSEEQRIRHHYLQSAEGSLKAFTVRYGIGAVIHIQTDTHTHTYTYTHTHTHTHARFRWSAYQLFWQVYFERKQGQFLGVLFCSVLLYYIISYYIILYYIILYYITLYYIILYYIILYSILFYSILFYSTLFLSQLCFTALYYIEL